MESIGSKLRTFFLTMTEEFVKPLQAALEYLNQSDLAGVGTAFGKAIADAATILLGLFKDGNIFKVMQLGLTIAFKESVNFIYDGFLYLGNVIVPSVGSKLHDAIKTALKYAFDYSIAAFNYIFSAQGMTAIAEGFIGVSAKFMSAMLSAVNTIVRVLASGVAYAIQAAIDAIPGLSKLIGNSQFGNITEAYDATEGIISQGFIDSLNQAGNDLSGKFGEEFDDAVAGIKATFSNDDRPGGSIFDTEKDKAGLADLIAKGFVTGQKAIDVVDSSNNKATAGTIGKFQSDPSRAIADSLARVGGGGNYIVAGQSLAQKQLMATERGAKASEEIAAAVTTRGGSPRPKPVPLGR